uniref:Secreted protein n=1 Tax=Cacopsylla melanoneura TaxID=428564 RepID=A0A8D8Q7T4_9HEMI
MTESLIGLFIVLSLVEHIQLFMRQVMSAWSCRLHIVSMVETEICFHWQEIHGREDWKRFLLLGLLHRSPKFIDHVAGKSGTEHRSFDGSQRDVFIGKSFMVETERCFDWQEVVVGSF